MFADGNDLELENQTEYGDGASEPLTAEADGGLPQGELRLDAGPEPEADASADDAWRDEALGEETSSDGGAAPEALPPAEEIAEPPEGGEAEPEAGEVGDVAEPADERKWYVIHCYSGREQKVKHKLEGRVRSLGMEEKIFQVVIPTEDEMELRQGERRTVERRIFPGYLLVQMILDDESWYAVQDTPGVIGFVGMGDRPTPLRPAEVSGIMDRMEADAPKIKVSFEAGEKVRIIDGPFDGFIGNVDTIDMERATVHVMVSFFGRETPVELDFLQVERI
jgi:transcriptional antiterminator NusG